LIPWIRADEALFCPRDFCIFWPVLEGRRIASVSPARDRGGKSELHRARCRVTHARAGGIDAGGEPETAFRRTVPQKTYRR